MVVQMDVHMVVHFGDKKALNRHGKRAIMHKKTRNDNVIAHPSDKHNINSYHTLQK